MPNPSPQSRDRSLPLPSGPLTSPVLLVAVLTSGLVYLVLFYLARLPSLEQVAGPGVVLRRGNFVVNALLLFDDHVLSWFGEPPQFSWLDRVPILCVATGIICVCTSVGWLLMVALRAHQGLTRLECFVFSLGVGLNTVSLYVLVVGLVGQLQNLWLFAVPGALSTAAAGFLWRSHRLRTDWPIDTSQAGTSDGTTDDWIDPHWLWLAVPFAAAVLLGGLLPPVDFDVREYHLQAPKEFFQRGRVEFLPHNVYGNMPLGPQMFSLLAMVMMNDWWSGALVGKTILACFVPFTAVALLAAGRRLFSRSAGVVAALVYVSIPWMGRVSNLGLVECAYAFYLLLACYALVLWQPVASTSAGASDSGGSSRPKLFLTGFLSGAAVACKYTAALFVVLPLGSWIFLARKRLDWKPCAVYLTFAALGCGLWLGKNLAFTGNPTYPLLYNVVGGKTWSEDKHQRWRAAHSPSNFSAKDAANQLSQVVLRSQWLSPLVFPLAALALFVGRHRRLVLWLWTYFGFVIICWWLTTHRIDRFWIPILPVLSLLAGVGATWSSHVLWRRGSLATLLLALLGNFVMITWGPEGYGPGGYNRFFVSYDRLRVSPERVDPWHRFLNQNVPPGHRLLVVGDAQVFDLEVPSIYHTVFDSCHLEMAIKQRSLSEFHEWLAQQRISHIFVHWGEIARYRSPGNYGFTEFVQPELFRELVDRDVISRIEPAIDGHPGEVFEVLPVPGY